MMLKTTVIIADVHGSLPPWLTNESGF